MRLLEHQSKQLLAGLGIPFTNGIIVGSPPAALEAVNQIGCPAVLKAQVPFGGRGKAGAVKFVENAAEAEKAASELLSMELRGVKVQSISVQPKVRFNQEFYMGIAWDIAAKLPVALLSLAGGVEVESSRSDQLTRRTFDPWTGISTMAVREMAGTIGMTGGVASGTSVILRRLSKAFLAWDALVAELNPVVAMADGTLICLDARVEIDDDAVFRQRERLAPFGEPLTTATGRAPTPLEREAQRIDAMDHRGVAGRVVEFEGDMALLIGGGGASLTVFDAVRRHGGNPANYCEVGGNPTEEKVAALTALLLSKPEVRKLAVIMNVVNNTRADVMARGVLQGIKQSGRKPAETISVFRIPGSWEQEARELLAQAGVEALGREISLDTAAKLAVEKMNGKTR